MKKYRLLKDTLQGREVVPKDIIITLDKDYTQWYYYKSYSFHKEIVENTPEWFEEVFNLQLTHFNRASINKYGIYFILNKVLSDKQFNKLKYVIQEFIDEENN